MFTHAAFYEELIVKAGAPSACPQCASDFRALCQRCHSPQIGQTMTAQPSRWRSEYVYAGFMLIIVTDALTDKILQKRMIP